MGLAPTVSPPVTRQYVPALRHTQETPLYPAAPSPKLTCATQTPVDQMLSVSRVWTILLERTDQCAYVSRGTEVRGRGGVEYCLYGGVCTGNGVTGCTRGDCISLRHEQCPDHRACYDSTCVGKVLYIQYITTSNILNRPMWSNILWWRTMLQSNCQL